jgi:S-formylglutathione hydrolase FrmB
MRSKFNKTLVMLWMASIAIFFVTGCGGGGGQLFEKQIPAKSIRKSLFGEAVEQPIAIYLPPSYASTSRKFPAVYVLTGFAAEVTDFLDGTYEGYRLDESMDLLIDSGAIDEMIVVVVNGRNFLGGSFYANSPVTGNWEDFVVKDVVRYVDTNYKTMPYPQSRGITGHGMGGTGALNIAMRHPDIFGAVYAISPELWDNQGMRLHGMFGGNAAVRHLLNKKAEFDAKTREEAHEAFTEYIGQLYASGEAIDTMWAFSYAYGAAFSPDPEANAPYIQYPHTLIDDRITLSPATWWAWDMGYGGIRKKVEQYGDNFRKLRAIGVDVGDSGHRHWVLDGCKYYAQRLKENDIAIDLVTHGGDNHDHVLKDRMEQYMFPWFSEHLVYR